MKLSIETHELLCRFGYANAVKMISQAGFDAYDFSFYGGSGENDIIFYGDYRENARNLRALSDDLGISCNQAHAPFELTGSDSFREDNPVYLRLIRSIETAAILGAENIIVHAISRNLPDGMEVHDFNRAYYRRLIPVCEKHNIHICVENISGCLRNPVEIQEFVRSLDSPWFRICADIGHFAVAGYKPEEALLQMDPALLAALHVHDNNLLRDDHQIPYVGQINWDGVTGALKQIGYGGDLTLELLGFLRPQEARNLPAALKFAEQTGRMLMEKIHTA